MERGAVHLAAHRVSTTALWRRHFLSHPIAGRMDRYGPGNARGLQPFGMFSAPSALARSEALLERATHSCAEVESGRWSAVDGPVELCSVLCKAVYKLLAWYEAQRTAKR